MFGDPRRQFSFVSQFFPSWIQQNHDGLPQKAGLQQDRISEVHGSLYDPSNPVVMMRGDLRYDQSAARQNAAENADLVLAMGTSLAEIGADDV